MAHCIRAPCNFQQSYGDLMHSSLLGWDKSEINGMSQIFHAKHRGIQWSDAWQAVSPSANVNAEPLYVKRKDVVTGNEEPPAVTTSEEMSTEQDDQADVPSGIPEFWLNVLRANTITQAKVSTCVLGPLPSVVHWLHL